MFDLLLDGLPFSLPTTMIKVIIGEAQPQHDRGACDTPNRLLPWGDSPCRDRFIYYSCSTCMHYSYSTCMYYCYRTCM